MLLPSPRLRAPRLLHRRRRVRRHRWRFQDRQCAVVTSDTAQPAAHAVMATHAAKPAALAQLAAGVCRHGPCAVRADAVRRCVRLRHQQVQQHRRTQLQEDVRLLPESAAAAACIATVSRATPEPTVVPYAKATSAVPSAIFIAATAATANDNVPATVAPGPRGYQRLDSNTEHPRPSHWPHFRRLRAPGGAERDRMHPIPRPQAPHPCRIHSRARPPCHHSRRRRSTQSSACRTVRQCGLAMAAGGLAGRWSGVRHGGRNVGVWRVGRGVNRGLATDRRV